MKTKKIAAISASAFAASMAHGSILYTYTNHIAVAGTQTVDNTVTIDLNQDGSPDYLIAFDNNNALKPYINNSVETNANIQAYVLSDATDPTDNEGLPLTALGTTIDANYESQQSAGFFYQDDSANVVGGWVSGGTNVQGYVGLELIDAVGETHYGWAQFVYNSTNVYNGVTGTLDLINFAMETGTNAIETGQTAEPGDPPRLPYPPTPQTAAVGFNAQFSAHATGNPNPAYQWAMGAAGSGVYTNLTDNGNLSGSASDTLTLYDVTMASQADLVCVLSNATGVVTSSPAMLTVVPLTFTGPTPSPATYYSGNNATLSVSTVSSVPVSYQWQKNGASLADGGRISGSSTPSLTISGASSADVANYSVVMSNVYGAVTSSVAPLIVINGGSPYQEAVFALNPVSYYSLNETNNPASGNAIAFDYAGGFNGAYGSLVQNGNDAIAGPRPTDGFPGFSSENWAMKVGTPKEYASFVNIPPLNLNTNTVSFVLWINPSSTEPAWAEMVSFRTTVAGTANSFNYDANGNLGYHWNDNGNSYNFDTGLLPPVDQWSFVALTIEPTNATFYLINSDGMSTVETYTNDYANNYVHPVQAFNTPGHIGGDDYDANFIGVIDEVAIFNQTLTTEQVTNLYNIAVNPPKIAVTLSITFSGGNVIVSWSPVVGTLYEATSPSGPWTSDGTTSPFVAPASATQKYYTVH
jgi:hypothetical protein